MFEEKDPADDRDEFDRRLKSIFDQDMYSQEFIVTALKALLINDQDEITKCKEKAEASNSKIKMYLDEWDAAKDKKTKEQVVSSVRND